MTLMVNSSVDILEVKSTKRFDDNASKVFLRPLTAENASATYLSWLQNTEVTKYLQLDSPPLSISDLVNYLSLIHKSSNDVLFGIFEKVQETHIGNIKLGGINWIHSFGDVGVMIGDTSYWRRGYASDALSLLCKIAFNHLCLVKLIAGANEENVGSSYLFTNAGFNLEGKRIHQYINRAGNRCNTLLFGLLRDDFNVR